MMFKRVNQTLIGFFLLSCLTTPMYAAQDAEDYPVTIRFSSNNDAKQMVQSTYSTLTDLNNALMNLNKYAVHSLTTGYFFEDQTFQDKKNKVTQALNKQKLTLHAFGKQELHVDFYDPKDSKHYAINIPVITFSELGLDNTDVSTIDNAKEAQKALIAAQQKLRFFLTPTEITAPDSNEKQTGLNILKIKNPQSFVAISNSLQQILIFYNKRLSRLLDFADKVISGKHAKEDIQVFNDEYKYLLYQLSWYINTEVQTINLLNIFKGNELTLNFSDKMQKTYYMPEISLSILQLDNDSIYDFESALNSYIDLIAARNWLLDWNITGQQEFSPASDLDRSVYAAHFAIKK